MNALGLTANVASRRLSGSFDGQSLFTTLRRNSATASEQYFERTGGVALIMTSALLNIRYDSQRVKINGLHDGAAPLLDAIEHRLSKWVVKRESNQLNLEFPRCKDADEEVRLLAETPFSVPRAILSLLKCDHSIEPFAVCLFGAIGFDHIDMFEALPERPVAASSFPDFEFWLADGLIIIEPDGSGRIISVSLSSGDKTCDHRQHHLSLERLADLECRCSKKSCEPDVVERAHRGQGVAPVSDLCDSDFEAIVDALKSHVMAGDIFQAVPSRTFLAECADALHAFERLGRFDPSAYRFFLSSTWGELFGASPETAVRLTRNGHELKVEVSPIAGTRPRGKSPDHDDRMQAELMLDAKEIAEHMMLVDLARNDVARVSRPGTRRVPALMQVEKFASVMHLVSKVEGVLGIGLDAFDALRACGTAGTLSGAPKLKAIELIRRYERTARGPYGGAALWINAAGEMDSAIIIRSALIADGIAQVRAGAGIVHDSIPSAEAEETRAKASAVLSAILDAA